MPTHSGVGDVKVDAVIPTQGGVGDGYAAFPGSNSGNVALVMADALDTPDTPFLTDRDFCSLRGQPGSMYSAVFIQGDEIKHHRERLIVVDEPVSALNLAPLTVISRLSSADSPTAVCRRVWSGHNFGIRNSSSTSAETKTKRN